MFTTNYFQCYKKSKNNANIASVTHDELKQYIVDQSERETKYRQGICVKKDSSLNVNASILMKSKYCLK